MPMVDIFVGLILLALGRHNIEDFKKTLEKRRKEYDTAVTRETTEMLEAETLKAEYEKVPKP
jgi:hypothetical protein